jgi:hypothetical protein
MNTRYRKLSLAELRRLRAEIALTLHPDLSHGKTRISLWDKLHRIDAEKLRRAALAKVGT